MLGPIMKHWIGGEVQNSLVISHTSLIGPTSQK